MFEWIDYALIGLIALSAVISLFRGFVREAMALLGWIAAVWMAVTFTEPVSTLFVDHIEVPSLRLAAAAATLFIGTLLACGVVVFVIGLLVDKTGLSGTDRVLGVVFGAVRGVVIVLVLVMLGALTPLPKDPWWQSSVLLPHFEQLAQRVRGVLPELWAQSMDFAGRSVPGEQLAPAEPAPSPATTPAPTSTPAPTPAPAPEAPSTR